LSRGEVCPSIAGARLGSAVYRPTAVNQASSSTGVCWS